MRRLIICERLEFFEGHCFSKDDLYLAPTIENIPKNITAFTFSNAKNLLGQNFNSIIFNACDGENLNFNLTAFAIAQGTLKAGGDMIILVPNIENLEQAIDYDSSRYFSKATPCPSFFAHFLKLIEKYQFQITKIFHLKNKRESYLPIIKKNNQESILNADQAVIMNNIFAKVNNIHIIKSLRGRGKSALLAEIANNSVLRLDKQVIFCARSARVMQTFWKFLTVKGTFFSPDNLTQAIKNNDILKDTILIIDEAASLPIEQLHYFCDFFDTTILATTTNNYEGTGNGFLLKFIPNVNKEYYLYNLSKPLRFLENDPLESFTNELLVLDELQNIDPNSPLACFELLKSAHYQTSPNDLRRLLDDDNQFFIKKIINNNLIGCAWLLNEGIIDKALIEPIRQGKRRVKGNLVVQYLALHLQNTTALTLKSARISRIAVDESLRNKGIGSEIIQQVVEHCENEHYDFISVSFGETKELTHFWEKLGFIKIVNSHKKATATGLKSSIMLYPLSKKGNLLVDELIKQKGCL